MVKGNSADEVVVAVVAVVLFALAVDQTRFDVSRARNVLNKNKAKKRQSANFHAHDRSLDRNSQCIHRGSQRLE